MHASREREKALEKKIEELTTRVQQVSVAHPPPNTNANPTALPTFNTVPAAVPRAAPVSRGGYNNPNNAHVQAIKNVITAMVADIHPGNARELSGWAYLSYSLIRHTHSYYQN